MPNQGPAGMERLCPGLATLLVGLVLLGAPVRLGAQAGPVTLDEYHRLAAESLAALESGSVTLDHVRTQWAAVEEVELPSGQVVAVSPLLGDPDEPVRDRQVAQARLAVVAEQLDAAARDDTAARLAQLDAVLAQPAFNRPADLWDRLVRWIGEQLRRILPEDVEGQTPVLAVVARIVPWVLAGLGAVLVVWLLSFWLQGILRNFVADGEARRRLARGEEAPLTAQDARDLARSAAESGRYRDAVRRLYLAALLHLREQRLVPNDPSLTNHEVLDRLPADAPVRPYLEPVVETFDQVWYGVREPDHGTYQAYTQAVDALEATVAAVPVETSSQVPRP